MMMDELVRILQNGNHSLVVAGDGIRTFDGQGISDLYGLLTEHPDWLRDASVADKVVGKGAAALLILGGVRELFADIISMSALGLLENSGISLRYAQKVPYIINRKGDSLCPIETLCKDCRTAAECLPLIHGFINKLSYDITDNWNMYADVNATHFNASYPGPVSAPLVDGDQRITRGVASFAVTNNYEKTSGSASFFYNWGKHWINDGYTPSACQTSQDGRFNSCDNMMGVSLFQSAQFFKGNRITFGFDWFCYGGKAWPDYAAGEREGTRNDLVDKHEDEFAGYMDFRQNIGKWLTLNAGLRVDNHSRVGTEWIPQAGFAFHLPYAIELKTSASKGFRYPILREMYMFPPQNPDLKPESMWNYEIALSQTLLNGRLNYGVNVFYIDGKDLIMILPNPNGSGMLNQNSGKIDNIGVE